MPIKAEFFKHDYNAQCDDKLVPLRMKMGAEGYGIYWLVVERLYQAQGRLERDYKALSWDTRVEIDKIKSVVEDFALFYDAKGKIACRRVDRDLCLRDEAREQAAAAGRKSAAQRSLNGRSRSVQQGEERRGEEVEDRTDAPSASDSPEYWTHRLQIGGKLKGAYVTGLDDASIRTALKEGRPNKEDRAALEWVLRERSSRGAGPRMKSGTVLSAKDVIGAGAAV